jgi:hypothetical protein
MYKMHNEMLKHSYFQEKEMEEPSDTKSPTSNFATLEVGPHEKMIGEEERELVHAALLCWKAAPPSIKGDNSAVVSPGCRLLLRDLVMTVADIMLACREVSDQVLSLVLSFHTGEVIFLIFPSISIRLPHVRRLDTPRTIPICGTVTRMSFLYRTAC